MALQVHQFICLSDNFGVLIHDPATGATATIDAPEAGPIVAALETKGWKLTDILLTHHHDDHIQGVELLKAAYPDVTVVGAKKDAHRLPKLARELVEGDEVTVGSAKARVIETPGHTSGHISYHFGEDALLFAGDTLFALGCGRAFECPAPVLYGSLQKLAALPEETRVYCGHEYTLGNAKFAVTVDPGNVELARRAADISAMRAQGQNTLPTTIGLELATNPFLRATDPGVQAAVGMTGKPAAEVFTELRERKNRG